MQKIIKALGQIGLLKQLRRSGWQRHSIKDIESVGSHIFRCAIIAIVIGDKIPKIDVGKLTMMCTVHDVAESDEAVGDITPFDGISLEKKFEMEQRSISQLSTMLNAPVLRMLWEEYEAQETIEAKIAYQIDKLEMALQAYEYQKSTGKNLQEFIDDADSKITHPVLRKIFKVLKSN
jgi:putative hydrolases of HD superfamily